jgi:predicted protein tyrosine phosphatase
MSVVTCLRHESRYECVMPIIHVCPLSRLHETVSATGAGHVVTLINVNTPVQRPASIAPDQHLFLGVSDIVEATEGHVLPGQDHVERLISFVDAWERAQPMVIHCWAGVSRSTAGAFIATCRLRPDWPEHEIAAVLRAASPMATPNARLVAVADQILGRKGRMTAAVAAIGRGADAFENAPFSLSVDGPRPNSGVPVQASSKTAQG